MHLLNCYVGQISLYHAKIEKMSKKFCHDRQRWGGNFWILWGDTAVMRGDRELMGVPPSHPTRETLTYGILRFRQLQGRLFGLDPENKVNVRARPLFFIGGVTFFVKKIVRKPYLAEKNCLHQGYELKKLSAKQREIFLEYIDISKF